MNFVYAVRSNFTRPELEEKWHDVPAGGGLYLAAFEGVAEGEAERRRAEAQAALADPARAIPLPTPLAAGVRETTFQPLTERRRAKPRR